LTRTSGASAFASRRRVVDQDVKSSECRGNFIKHGSHRAVIGNVGLHSVCLPLSGADDLSDLACAVV
jgi:hypothetical protein